MRLYYNAKIHQTVVTHDKTYSCYLPNGKQYNISKELDKRGFRFITFIIGIPDNTLLEYFSFGDCFYRSIGERNFKRFMALPLTQQAEIDELKRTVKSLTEGS